MDAIETTELTEGQMVGFYLDGRCVAGEILRATPSTQTILYGSQTYEVHRSRLHPVPVASE